MSFAVVKFLNETDEDKEVVQEVPTSWLCKNNTACKWPPEKYAKIYINKQFPPEEEWEEHPVETEGFFDSLQEAHSRANNGTLPSVSLGRGQRSSKPRDYFSPAEEMEREAIEKKKFKKKPIEGVPVKNFTESFLLMMGQSKEPETNAIIDIDERGCVNEIAMKAPTFEELALISSPTSSTAGSNKNLPVPQDDADRDADDDSLPSNLEINSATGQSSSDIQESDTAGNISTKLDKICSFLAELKVDIAAIKERLGEKEKIEEKISFPVDFPLKSLSEIDKLDNFLKLGDDDTVVHFKRLLKSVGGRDAKELTHRICKYIFTNGVAILCSWTGRKNNYALDKLKVMEIVYDVIHQKTKLTKKEFENFIMEWFRHSAQRKQREKIIEK